MDNQNTQLRRWRLILGDNASTLEAAPLSDSEQIMDQALGLIYEGNGQDDSSARSAGRGASSPKLAKWLVDVRNHFPKDVVSVIQADAIERKGLTQLLLEPESLQNVTPDINMVSNLLALKDAIPEKSKDSARALIKAVVDQIMKKMETDLRRAVTGVVNKKAHTPIANFSSTDWKRTIERNLKNYDVATKRLIPERFFFFERSQKQKNWTVILDIDQSGSMYESIIYSSIMGAIFASMPVLETHVVAFDTNIMDLTELCRNDPVDALFGFQMGGGTDINKSVSYCQTLITEPKKTIFILISDLYEGGVRQGLLRRLASMKDDGVIVITLLALTDSGRPDYDKALGKEISNLGVPCFACTPDQLPEMIGAALKGHDLKHFETTTL
ncbi:VWA domain-containing protein [Wohlfahrtiimonas chitiniclastica]|uniref:VWA domain-containing protein n=1 Tax=Wohlfahrtiimonas chitiniclastica TaxID=400946 RepID=UPI0003774454|nr:VWA domain-containing protein [Wohlfahrtiimonas chitiniclastica]